MGGVIPLTICQSYVEETTLCRVSARSRADWFALEEHGWLSQKMCPSAEWSAHQRASGSGTVVKAILLTSIQEALEQQWHERDWMSYYNVWCGKSLRRYFIYTYQDKSVTCPIQATGDSTGNCIPQCLPLFKSNTIPQCYSMQIVSCIKQGRDEHSKDCCTAGDAHGWLTAFQNKRMLDEKRCRHLLFSWQSRSRQQSEPDSKHATYPSLYEASWRADARMSISMRLSCKVSRNACFAMFLHTGGKMDMKLVWDTHARNTQRPIQFVITKQHQQLTNGGQDGQYETKPRPLWNYFYKGERQITSSSLIPLVWTLPYLVLYEPCPSLQASCSSLINIRVFGLL